MSIAPAFIKEALRIVIIHRAILISLNRGSIAQEDRYKLQAITRYLLINDLKIPINIASWIEWKIVQIMSINPRSDSNPSGEEGIN